EFYAGTVAEGEDLAVADGRGIDLLLRRERALRGKGHEPDGGKCGHRLGGARHEARARRGFGAVGTQNGEAVGAFPRRIHAPERDGVLGAFGEPGVEILLIGLRPFFGGAARDHELGGAALDVACLAHVRLRMSAGSENNSSARSKRPSARYSFTVSSPMPMRVAISRRERPSTWRR